MNLPDEQPWHISLSPFSKGSSSQSEDKPRRVKATRWSPQMELSHGTPPLNPLKADLLLPSRCCGATRVSRQLVGATDFEELQYCVFSNGFTSHHEVDAHLDKCTYPIACLCVCLPSGESHPGSLEFDMNHVILSDTVRTQLFDFICKSANEVSHTCWHSCKHRRGFSSREGHRDFQQFSLTAEWSSPCLVQRWKQETTKTTFTRTQKRQVKLILWCNKNLETIYLYIWDFRKGQNMVQRMSLGLYPSTPQPFRESFVKMWNCWISKCWGVALIVFSSRLSPLLLSLQLRQFAFLGAFPAGSQRLLHRVFKATHATRVAGCMTVCDATWHTGGLPDTMAFFHSTALAGQSSQRAESQEAETQEDLRMCFQDMKSSIFLLCHLSLLHLLHHIWPEYHLRN